MPKISMAGGGGYGMTLTNAQIKGKKMKDLINRPGAGLSKEARAAIKRYYTAKARETASKARSKGKEASPKGRLVKAKRKLIQERKRVISTLIGPKGTSVGKGKKGGKTKGGSTKQRKNRI